MNRMTNDITSVQWPERLRALSCAVVIPTYNNAGTLRDIISRSLRYCHDLIVVNDGSTDRTASVLETIPGIRVIAYPDNRGKGYALHTGLKAAARIKKHSPDIRVVIMTSMPEHSFRQKALAAGCEGFWYKEHGDADLLEVCDRVMAGETVSPAEGPSVRVGWADSRDFTARELEILRELALGRRYEAIAGDLGISPNTVKYHVKNLLQKTGYETAMQLIADVVEKRLVLPKY